MHYDPDYRGNTCNLGDSHSVQPGVLHSKLTSGVANPSPLCRLLDSQRIKWELLPFEPCRVPKKGTILTLPKRSVKVWTNRGVFLLSAPEHVRESIHDPVSSTLEYSGGPMAQHEADKSANVSVWSVTLLLVAMTAFTAVILLLT
jgi:hypothetical protein